MRTLKIAGISVLSQSKLPAGGGVWVPGGVTSSVRNNTANTQRFVTLELTELKK